MPSSENAISHLLAKSWSTELGLDRDLMSASELETADLAVRMGLMTEDQTPSAFSDLNITYNLTPAGREKVEHLPRAGFFKRLFSR